MEYETKFHKAEEFPNLPWATLVPSECSRNWSFGRGGHGLRDDQYTVSIPHPDGNGCDYWQLPDALSAVLEMAKECAAEGALSQVRRALGV